MKQLHSLYFVGIGGSGMAPLAELAHRVGHKVRGSDPAESHGTKRLEKFGVEVISKQTGEYLDKSDTVVISSAILDDNPELLAAKKLGLKTLHRSELLNQLMSDHKSIAITGTHGKTTTSAMIVHVLETMNQDPTAVIGGVMKNHDSACRKGGSNIFVAEADESDRSFLNYNPYIGVLTNVDKDHLENFGSQAELNAAFQKFVGNIDDDGVAIIGWDSPLARELTHEMDANRLTYGFLIGSEIRAVNYRVEGHRAHFIAVVERDQIEVTLPVIGRHNVQNALCSLAVCRALEMDVAQAAKALESFPGVKRRLDLIFANENLMIFDDYAHNPGKISAVITTLKEAWPNRSLHVVYQPHRFSRLATMYEEMLGCVEDSDFLYILPVYTAGETTDEDFSPERLAKDFSQRYSSKTFPCQDFTNAVQSIQSELNKNDVVITIGAGDVWKVADLLKKEHA